jgi:excisionase family DNA binding protein
MSVTTSEQKSEWLSVREVAEELRCSEPTVWRRIREGQLPAARLGGRGSPVRVPRAGLQAWLWSQPNEPNEQGD